MRAACEPPGRSQSDAAAVKASVITRKETKTAPRTDLYSEVSVVWNTNGAPMAMAQPSATSVARPSTSLGREGPGGKRGVGGVP